MTSTQDLIHLAEAHGAPNYHPLPIVISKAENAWVEDPEGRRFLDMLSAYSALNHGHRHPKIVQALKDQADRCTLTSRAFHNDQIGPFLAELSELTGMDMALPMNTGAEAVETAVKLARKWGYEVKGVEDEKAEIIVCENNFHGRTTTVISFSTEAAYKKGFGPFTPGFKAVPYGDADALEKAITKNTVAFLVEPIQGEAGVVVPPDGYLAKVREICTRENVLLMTDEIQTGLGRTGKTFCFQHDGIRPDVLILGKALGGGAIALSAVCASKDLLDLFQPGTHGSTFGGSPLACAVGRAAMKVLVDEKLVERAAELGGWFMDRLRAIDSPHVDHVRGKGLLIGVVLKPEAGGARPYCEKLMELGILAKDTHEDVIRFAPPLTIEKKDLEWALERIAKVLTA